MKKIQKILIWAVIIFIVGTLAALAYLSDRVKYNAEGTLGNTAGNLMNGGKFAEHNGIIYFSNPYDHDQLYSMNSDCSNLKKLSDDTASYINVCDNYIFYVRNNFDPDNAGMLFRGQLYGVVRTKLNGSHSRLLTSDITSQMVLNGNTIIYGSYKDARISTHYLTIDKKSNTAVKNTEIPMYCLYNNKLYYSGSGSDHSVYAFDCSTCSTQMVLEGNTYLASIVDGTIYYIDMANNYALTKYDPATGISSVLYDGRCINYNVYDSVIFFQTEDGNNALHRMNIDGSNDTILIKGNTDSISCTSQYTFFTFYGQNTFYRVPTYTGTTVGMFLYTE